MNVQMSSLGHFPGNLKKLCLVDEVDVGKEVFPRSSLDDKVVVRVQTACAPMGRRQVVGGVPIVVSDAMNNFGGPLFDLRCISDDFGIKSCVLFRLDKRGSGLEVFCFCRNLWIVDGHPPGLMPQRQSFLRHLLKSSMGIVLCVNLILRLALGGLVLFINSGTECAHHPFSPLNVR